MCRLRYASAVESCQTPADNRGSTSPSVSISGVPSPAVNGRSFYGVHIVQPFCYWPSSPSLSTHLHEYDIIFHCVVPPLILVPLRPDVFQHPYIAFSLNPRVTTLSSLASNTTSQMHQLSSSRAAFHIVQVSAPYRTIGNTKAFTSFTFVASLIPLSFHIGIKPPIAALPIPIILRISLSHNLSLVINAPRNMKLVTTSTIFPSTVTSPISPVVMTVV